MSTPEGLKGQSLIHWRLKQLEAAVEGLEKKFDTIQNWLRALMGSIVVALLLLVANLLVKKS